MLNQVAVEALYSATYLENYLDSVENLPNDLQRHISRMRQLDVDFQGKNLFSPLKHITNYVCTGILQDIERYQEILQKGPDAASELEPPESGTVSSGSQWRKQIIQKLQTALIQSLEIGDEKVQIVQTMQEEVENKSRQLETNCKALGKTSFKIISGHIILYFNS